MTTSLRHDTTTARFGALVAFVLMASFALLACSSDDDTTPQGGTDTIADTADGGTLDTTTSPDTEPAVDTIDAVDTLPDTLPDVVETVLVDTIEDSVPEVEEIVPVDIFELPPSEVVIESHCTEPGGGVNIFDLQDEGCPDHPAGDTAFAVTIEDVVITAVFSDTIFVQDRIGGPYSGIAVFTHGMYTGDLLVGDAVTIVGTYKEYFGMSQVYLEEWSFLGHEDPPDPFIVAYPHYVATGGELAEPLEGVFVIVSDLEVINTRPDCPHEFGEFMVTGDLRIDDMGSVTHVAQIGDHFGAIQGPLHYTFGNFKLEPRDDDDLALISAGEGGVTKCINMECIEAIDAPETGTVVINEIMYDPFGEDTYLEYFELYNPGSSDIDLTGWTIKDCAVQEHVITASGGLVIPAKGYVVLGKETNTQLNGGTPVDYAFGDGYYLANTEGAILLYDAVGDLVDQTRFASFEPWPHEIGRSLELLDPSLDNTVPANWALAVDKYGVADNQGSPGESNTVSF